MLSSKFPELSSSLEISLDHLGIDGFDNYFIDYDSDFTKEL